MIRASFAEQNGNLIGFSIQGHALFDEYGRDIVCAAVTSAVQLTANGITEVVGERAQVDVKENEISFRLSKDCRSKEVFQFLKALYLHLDLLRQDYSGTIDITISEV